MRPDQTRPCFRTCLFKQYTRTQGIQRTDRFLIRGINCFKPGYHRVVYFNLCSLNRFNGKPGLDSWTGLTDSWKHGFVEHEKWTQTSNFTIFIYFNDSIHDSSFSVCVFVNRLKYRLID